MKTRCSREMLITRLWSFQLPEKAFPYYRGFGSANEATLLALLAFFAAGVPIEKTGPVLSNILSQQNADGSIGACAQHRADGVWLTAHLAIVLHHYGYFQQRDRALNFLRNFKSDASTTALHDHNELQADIEGWPWVRNTFGWVEPTAWALLAFKLSGQNDDTRAIQGRSLLIDRQISSGGWNYGNKEVMGTQLLPFWDTTALALLALQGSRESAAADVSIRVLEKEGPAISSLYGLALTTICLHAYKKNIDSLKEHVCEVMSQPSDEEINMAHYALGLIALSEKSVFTA
jgi:hypothetical protein